jgi:hypothetical protein
MGSSRSGEHEVENVVVVQCNGCVCRVQIERGLEEERESGNVDCEASWERN